MKTLLISTAISAAAFFAAGCLYPHIPTDLPTNGGAKIVISNMTLTTPWGTERIEYFESRAVENQTTNAGGFIPLAPKKP